MKNEKKDNVIDMTDRIQSPDFKARLRHLKVRFDLEQAKIAVSTSLLSVVLLATFANKNLFSLKQGEMNEVEGSRAIASIPTGTSEVEDQIVHKLSTMTVHNQEGVGHPGTALDSLAYGTLEGKYSVQSIDGGKLASLEFSDLAKKDGAAAQPTRIDDPSAFIEANRGVMPVNFTRSLKVAREASTEGGFTEIYQLVDRVSRPVGRVQFSMDAQGRLLGLHVTPEQVASR